MVGASGRSDKGGLPADRLLDLYYLMRLVRAVDDRLEILYRQGRIQGSVYSWRGQEGTHVGVAAALRDGDWLGSTHRDLPALIVKGLSLRTIFAGFLGKETGPTRGRDSGTHAGDLRVGAFTPMSMLPDLYPVAAGAALASKIRGDGAIAMAICGEGATAAGIWFETLNMAALWRLPIVFVVNNNQWAYSTPMDKHTPVPTVAQRAAAFGFPGVRVDGFDVVAVHKAAAEAAERARRGDGPTLIESLSFRQSGHAGHDPASYVPEEMREEWGRRDPVARFERRLLDQGVLTEDRVEETGARIKAQIDDAVAYAKEAPEPNPEDTEDGVFAAAPQRSRP